MTKVEILKEKASFPNAWARAIKCVLRKGSPILFGGKEEIKQAIDLDLTIVLEGNTVKEILERKLHPQFPIKEKGLEEYLKQFRKDFDYKKKGFTYTYGSRCYEYESSLINSVQFKEFEVTVYHQLINQLELAKENLQWQIDNNVCSNRNVICIMDVKDRIRIPHAMPCLQRIWIRHEGNKKISVKTTFRSHDLYSAWMANMVGIIDMINREVIQPVGAEITQIVEKNDSLHIYGSDIENARRVKLVPVNPQLMG